MDLRYSEEYEAFREEVRSFLQTSWPLKGDAAELPAGEQAALFRQRAIEQGYLARAIPQRYGGSEQDPDVLKATIIGEEFARARAPCGTRSHRACGNTCALRSPCAIAVADTARRGAHPARAWWPSPSRLVTT